MIYTSTLATIGKMTLNDLEDNIELGRQIFEAVPKAARPGWGTTLLQTFENYIDNVPQLITELYDLTSDEQEWGKAHEQFTKIRRYSLANSDYQPESYLILAERVAKTTYNESGLSAPFDHHSGWAMAYLATKTADHFDDPILKTEIQRILTVNLNKK